MPHERLSWPWPSYGGHAPGLTRAMVTHGLQLVLWTPWPQALQYSSRRRYCVNWAGYTGPIHTCETTGHAPTAVLDAHPERRRGTVSAQSAPNPMRCVSSCCQPSLSSPLDGMQANSKPLVSSTHAQTTNMVHGPDGPTRGRAEAMWGWRQNRSSKAGKVLHMRSHEPCCFFMMRTMCMMPWWPWSSLLWT